MRPVGSAGNRLLTSSRDETGVRGTEGTSRGVEPTIWGSLFESPRASIAEVDSRDTRDLNRYFACDKSGRRIKERGGRRAQE